MTHGENTYKKIVCPLCGRTLPVRIVELKGELRYSLRCPDCKEVSEVVIKND